MERTKNISFEIIVVDNNSNDRSVEMLKREFSEHIIIVNKKNIGFVKANNVAIQHSKGKYVLFLNPDTVLVTNPIFKMADFLEKNKSYGAVGCKLILPDGQIQYVCARAFPTPFNQFCFLSMLDRLFPKSIFFSSVEIQYWDHNDNREVECLSGANLMIRKDIIDQLNGFDTNLFMYAEDVDLCYRIKKLGWKLYYLSEEIIIHYAGSSSKKQKNKYFSAIMQRESNLYFQKKHFGKAKENQYLTAVFTGSLIRIFIITILIPFSFLSTRFRRKMSPLSITKYITLLKWSVSKKSVFLNKVDEH
jgi:GT2 family glycosyltransferase